MNTRSPTTVWILDTGKTIIPLTMIDQLIEDYSAHNDLPLTYWSSSFDFNIFEALILQA